MTENRKCCRNTQSAGKPVQYRYEHALTQYGAVLINHGDGGVCLQTGYELTPGRQILLSKMPAAAALGCDPRRIRTGLIKWCHNVPDFDAFFYRVGVAFIDHGE